MKVLAGGCRVYEAGEGELAAHGPWTARTVMSRASGTTLITQTINDYAVGTAPGVVNPQSEEVLYVVRGAGFCRLDGYAYPLRPGVGMFIPPGSPYSIENRGTETLHTVSACCPEDTGRRIGDAPVAERGGEPARRSVHEDEREAIRAGRDRVFRYLVHTDVGCREVTQFVGWIPKSQRALPSAHLRGRHLHSRRARHPASARSTTRRPNSGRGRAFISPWASFTVSRILGRRRFGCSGYSIPLEALPSPMRTTDRGGRARAAHDRAR